MPRSPVGKLVIPNIAGSLINKGPNTCALENTVPKRTKFQNSSYMVVFLRKGALSCCAEPCGDVLAHLHTTVHDAPASTILVKTFELFWAQKGTGAAGKLLRGLDLDQHVRDLLGRRSSSLQLYRDEQPRRLIAVSASRDKTGDFVR
jgi:hypothetical protein